MRFSRKGKWAAAALLLPAAAASLPEWVRHIEAGAPIEALFFREVEAPGGSLPARRPPAEARALLDERVVAEPSRADLRRLRALEAERALDFEAAERDWVAAAELAEDPAQGRLDLADFHHRRLRPSDEAAALIVAGRAPAPLAERFTPAAQQRSWSAFLRVVEVAQAHLLPAQTVAEAYVAWIERYPAEREPRERYLDFLLTQQRWEAAERLIADSAAAFGDDPAFAARARARIARAQRGDAAGLDAFEQAFDPLWDDPPIQEYFELLSSAGRERSRLDEARAARAADPDDLAATAWLYHYRRRQGDLAAARFELDEFERSKQNRGANWSARELSVLAALYRRAGAHDRAARAAYALYSLPGATPDDREAALATLIDLLLSAPEQPIRLGSGDLSFYRDAATADAGPGFLNGLLSLLLNSQDVPYRARYQQQLAEPYFRRAQAAELIGRLESEFPASSRRPELRARLIEVYGVYGDDDALIEEGERFLADFPAAARRTAVSLRIAEAFARRGRETDEFAVYDRLLVESADRSDHVPFGAGGARSPDYARVFDLYVARLAGLGRLQDAIRLHAREISRNPDDPGLYERLAGFLDANGLAAQVEAVYRQAMARFPDRSWDHKLARWFLRRSQTAQFEQLTREFINAFDGTELETYFSQVVPGVGADAHIYLRLNLFAHRRFPRNPTFTRNLLNAYRRRETADPAAWEALIRRSWFTSDESRVQYLQHLTASGRLESEIAALEAALRPNEINGLNRAARANPPATLLLAEARAWRGHFEEAAPALLALTAEAPIDQPTADRAAAIHRSLAHQDPVHTDIALSILDSLSRAAPGDRSLSARAGDVAADRGLFDRAEPLWRRMAETEPGRPDAYLDAATVFWDYFDFDAAREMLDAGRRRLRRPELFAYEAGAIEEGRGDAEAAVAEYLRGALAAERDQRAFERLAALSRRDPYAETIESATARLTAGLDPSAAALELRAAVLERNERKEDLRALAERLTEDAGSFETLDAVERIAARNGFEETRARVLERRVELTRDPVEATRLRLSLMRLRESLEDWEAADRVAAELYREQPLILGVARARIDYLWRRGRRDEALDALVETAEHAHPALARRLRFEAAGKALEAERYVRARALLETLLEDDPFNAAYLTAMADSYAREGRDEDLRTFQEGKIAEIQQSARPAAEKRATLGGLRRGLIEALTRLDAPEAAVDQYVELLRAFPEDESLAREAARFARRNQVGERLESVFARASEESPRDIRPQRALAWIRAESGHLSGAIEGYSRALAVRPESIPLRQARADLEVRAGRFEEALADYLELYELSYENPFWMDRAAECLARLGRSDEAIEAVSRAHVAGRPRAPAHHFAAARRLAELGLFEAARESAEQGLEAAGSRIFDGPPQDLGLYMRLHTQSRRYSEAFARLSDLQPAVDSGYLWSRWAPAAEAAAVTAKAYFNAAESAEFDSFLGDFQRRSDPAAFDQALWPALRAAGLAESEARRLFEQLLARPQAGDWSLWLSRLIELQRARMLHDELGAQLERIWAAHPARRQQGMPLIAAADAYQEAGDEDAEFRARETARGADILSERYFELLLKRDPERLVEFAGARGAIAGEAVNYAVFHADADLARRAVEAFGSGRKPVWLAVHRGLVGLFHAAPAERFGAAFEEALGGGAIGERVARPVDRDLRLAGDLWFAHASRRAEYLALSNPAAAEDYLAAELENHPGRASAYFALGEFHLERAESAAARREFNHVLQLDPDDARAHDRLARLALAEGRREEALAAWARAFELHRGEVERARLGARFWEEVPSLLTRLAAENLLGELREPLDRFIETYVRHGGTYRAAEIYRPFVGADGARLDRVLDLADRSPAPLDFLGFFADAEWLAVERRVEAARRAADRARRELAAAPLASRYYPRDRLNQAVYRLAELSLAAGRGDEAHRLLTAEGDELLTAIVFQNPGLLFRAAAAAGALDDAVRRVETSAQGGDVLQRAAADLRAAGRRSDADQVLEIYLSDRLMKNDLVDGDILALAEIYLGAGRVDEALQLLRDRLPFTREPFGLHVAAADLPAQFDRPEEARRLLSERAAAAPWDMEARVKLALAEGDAAEAERLAARPETPNAVRALAAGPSQEPGDLRRRLAADPDAVDARLGYFRASRAAGDHRAAVAALMPLIESSPIGYLARSPQSAYDVEPREDLVDPWSARELFSGIEPTRSGRARLAAEAADSLRRLGRLQAAAALYEAAIHIDGDRPADRQALDEIRIERRRRAENARRRPVVTNALEQPRTVRPRLAAGGGR